MKKNNPYSEDPFFKCTDEEMKNMTKEEFCALIEESNEYVRNHFGRRNEEEMPRFNTLQELLEYYDAIPFEEAVNKMNRLFDQ